MSEAKGPRSAPEAWDQGSHPAETVAGASDSVPAKDAVVHLPTGEPGFTDLGNAMRLVARHGDDLRYVRDWRSWLVWDGRRWVRDRSGEVERRAKDTVRGLYRQAAKDRNASKRQQLADHARRSEADPRIRAMIHLAESELPISVLPEQLDRDSMLFTVANGTLDLSTGELQPSRRRDLITKLADVNHDPAATCPAWIGFLARIFAGNLELIYFMQKAVGYTLTGLTREQVIFLLHGLGANGKSTFLETIRTLLGDHAAQADASTFLARPTDGIRNDLARLAGVRFVSAVEVGGGRRLAEPLVKQLTGGDTISARFLYGEYFEYKPAFKVWIAANQKPVIRGTDLAIWRRIRLIPFTVTIPEDERDPSLGERLRDELPGILAWALRGCLDWQRDALGPPDDVLKATADYRSEMDELGPFLDEMCLIRDDVSAPATELYGAYRRWVEASHDRPMSQTAFGLRLAERGHHRHRGSGGRIVWEGIGLQSEGLKSHEQ